MTTILHVIDTTGPGGAETVFIELADQLRKHEYRSVVVVRGRGWVYDELERRGLTPLVLDAKGAFNWRFLRRLVDIIRREHIDVIQSHLLGSNVYCALAGLLTRRPVIATFHGMVDVNPNERLRWLKLQLMNLGVNRFVTVSNSLQSAIQSEGLLNPAKTDVIYNGVDLARYSRSSARDLRGLLGLDNEAVLIGSLGNVRPAKGYDLLIDAAYLIVGDHPEVHFVVAGDIKHSLMGRLEKLAAQRGVTAHIHFLGYQNDSAAFLAQLDMFLLSSTSEGFSISTVEAMAAGLPIVATRCGGPEEIVATGVDGLLVDISSEAIASGLLKLLEHPAYAEHLASAGRIKANAYFSREAMLKRYIDLYQSSLSSA